MNHQKREEQQGKKNKEREENTHIRRITTNNKTFHAIQRIEGQDKVSNNTTQARREEEEEETR